MWVFDRNKFLHMKHRKWKIITTRKKKEKKSVIGIFGQIENYKLIERKYFEKKEDKKKQTEQLVFEFQ